MKSKRPFGEIPDWAKKGPVTLRNYDLRSEWYGAKIKEWRDGWPFLSTDPEYPATADQTAWEAYFLKQLGAFPPSYQLFKRGVMRAYNLPDVKPELFDTSYDPRPKLSVIRNVMLEPPE